MNDLNKINTFKASYGYHMGRWWADLTKIGIGLLIFFLLTILLGIEETINNP